MDYGTYDSYDTLAYLADDTAAIADMIEFARINYDNDHKQMDDALRIVIMALRRMVDNMTSYAEENAKKREIQV